MFSYGAETEKGVAQAIIRSVLDFKRDPWPKVSETAKDLVRKMLDPDPRRRLTAQGVLGNILFNGWKTFFMSGIFQKVLDVKNRKLDKNFIFFLKCRSSLVAKCRESSKCFFR